MEQLVEQHIGLALTVAHRLGRRRDDDIEQVAMEGLVKAAHRFDAERGVQFGTFAWRTIEGEIKRYFRDTNWATHVSRSLQERCVFLRDVIEQLTREKKSTPSVGAIAEASGCTPEEVIEVLELQRNGHPSSLPGTDATDADGFGVPVRVEGDFDAVDDRMELMRCMRHLPPRQQSIVWLRFGEELSQAEIGQRLGISQMHVSRLLAKSLASMREVAALS